MSVIEEGFEEARKLIDELEGNVLKEAENIFKKTGLRIRAIYLDWREFGNLSKPRRDALLSEVKADVLWE